VHHLLALPLTDLVDFIGIDVAYVMGKKLK